jgi:hypothetical protein
MYLQNEILRAIKEKGLVVNSFSEAFIHEFYSKIYTKYSAGKDYYPTWNYLTDHSSVYKEHGWEDVQHFVGANSCLLFLESVEGEFLIELKNGADLNTLIENTSGFVFYVSDQQQDYLICYNDHDYLIGCGTAKKWIEKGKS